MHDVTIVIVTLRRQSAHVTLAQRVIAVEADPFDCLCHPSLPPFQTSCPGIRIAACSRAEDEGRVAGLATPPILSAKRKGGLRRPSRDPVQGHRLKRPTIDGQSISSRIFPGYFSVFGSP